MQFICCSVLAANENMLLRDWLIWLILQIGKDPDVRVDSLFVLGEVMPVETAKTQLKVTVPYNSQHKYFFLSELVKVTIHTTRSTNTSS